jgi:DNA polymerase I-like protein with 3'-5' exonuclease and polymerase domains
MSRGFIAGDRNQLFLLPPSVDKWVHRKLAKEIVLGLNNGMTQYGIHHQLTKMGFPVDLSSVETFVHKYVEEFDGIFKWRQAVVRRAKAEKQLRTRIGRLINVAARFLPPNP